VNAPVGLFACPEVTPVAHSTRLAGAVRDWLGINYLTHQVRDVHKQTQRIIRKQEDTMATLDDVQAKLDANEATMDEVSKDVARVLAIVNDLRSNPTTDPAAQAKIDRLSETADRLATKLSVTDADVEAVAPEVTEPTAPVEGEQF